MPINVKRRLIEEVKQRASAKVEVFFDNSLNLKWWIEGIVAKWQIRTFMVFFIRLYENTRTQIAKFQSFKIDITQGLSLTFRAKIPTFCS